MNGVEYCYVVTCERHGKIDTRLSGACYHDFENAIRFIENRSDKPKKISETNPFLWFSNQYVYKIHTLTFDD